LGDKAVFSLLSTKTDPEDRLGFLLDIVAPYVLRCCFMGLVSYTF